jgi:hypothetical protein
MKLSNKLCQDLLGIFYFRNSTIVHYVVRQFLDGKKDIRFGNYVFGSDGSMIFRANYEFVDMFAFKPIESIPGVYERYVTL